MVKRTVVIGLIVLITSFIWRDAIVFGVFKIQQDNLSKNVCIERNTETSHCKGNCVLTERLTQTAKAPSKSEPEPNLVLIEIKMELFISTEKESNNEAISIAHVFNYLIEDELQGFLHNQIIPPEIV